MQSKFFSSEEVTALLKISGLLYLVLIIGLAILSTSDTLPLWNSKYVKAKKATEEISSYQVPVQLMHNMSDGDLFKHALHVNEVYQLKHKREVPKIAFLFLTTRRLHMVPLWERYFQGYESLYSIYIHENPPYQGYYPPPSVFHNRQIPSQLVKWCNLSIVDAERRLMANALLDLSNEWFMILSESCIPIYNFSTTYNYLKDSKYIFVDAYIQPGMGGSDRYKHALEPEITFEEWRKGSQWLQFNRKLSVLIVNDTKYYPKFDQNRDILFPEEHYMHTLLNIVSPQLLAYRTLTWTDWSRPDTIVHPATYNIEDITEELLRSIREVSNCTYNDQPGKFCYLFARKFAPKALIVLLDLAPSVLGYGDQSKTKPKMETTQT